MILQPPLEEALTAARYHARTKHAPQAYALGPNQIDWTLQPSAFQSYPRTMRFKLPLPALSLPEPLPLSDPGRPLSLASIGAFLQLSFGISAWKRMGRQQWPLRSNPSSGNLHPVEAHLGLRGIPGLPAGLYHYDPFDHALELRAQFSAPADAPALLLALSSLPWREAWKYGERAFRYCQLDVGHAIGCAGYAAAALGWKIATEPVTGSRLARALKLAGTKSPLLAGEAPSEREYAELVLQLGPDPAWPPLAAVAQLEADLESATWQGIRSSVGGAGEDWPVVHTMYSALAECVPGPPVGTRPAAQCTPLPIEPFASVRTILERRSAQQFDPSSPALSRKSFDRILDATYPRGAAPWTALEDALVHLALFVTRVEGLTPGIYFLSRQPAFQDFPTGDAQRELSAPAEFAAHLRLQLFSAREPSELAATVQQLCCRQEFVRHAHFSVAMLGEFDRALAGAPDYGYTRLLREAGVVGQALYLAAEAAGLRGTGLGCFFDDAVHETLALTGTRLQSLYHFAIGAPLADPRLEHRPAYPGR